MPSQPLREKGTLRRAVYGGGPVAFFRILQTWRGAGDLAGLALR